MTTKIFRSAIAALVFVAMACGGGDPPGGGNGDTDGGGNTVNLIEAIPGRWRMVRALNQPVPPGMYEGDVRVDVNDPDCRQRITETYGTLGLGGDPTGGPPGDACIDWLDVGYGTVAFILDGTSVRFDAREPNGINDEFVRVHVEGTVLNDGLRIEFTVYGHSFDPPDTERAEAEKVR